MADDALKPLLRWAGSKQRLIPSLLERLPNKFDRYIEPFVGSASLFFAIKPKKSLLSDVNPDLVNFYTQVRTDAERLHQRLNAMSIDELTYLKVRRKFSVEEDLFIRALYFWYLNRCCFNGLYRTNGSGIFNVPFGSKLPSIPTRQGVLDCVRQLKKSRIICSDYKVAMAKAKGGDFIYVDPPYSRGGGRSSGEYGLGAMQDSEMGELLELIRQASGRGAQVLLSYNADLSHELPGWQSEILRGRYLISADPSRRKAIQEFTFKNY